MSISAETRGRAQTALNPDAVTVAHRFQKPKDGAVDGKDVSIADSGAVIVGVSEEGTDAVEDTFALRTSGHFTVDAPSQTITAGQWCMAGAAGIAIPYALATEPASNYAVLARTAATGGAGDQIIVDLSVTATNPELLP